MQTVEDVKKEAVNEYVKMVVEELEVLKDVYDHSCIDNAYERGVEAGAKWIKKKAIEIVKQGGVAYDVCEWKSASDGEFIQNPHTKRLYSNEPSMQNVYCNTCGKKIKIVGD